MNIVKEISKFIIINQESKQHYLHILYKECAEKYNKLYNSPFMIEMYNFDPYYFDEKHQNIIDPKRIILDDNRFDFTKTNISQYNDYNECYEKYMIYKKYNFLQDNITKL